MRIILLGPPGARKGTQVERIVSVDREMLRTAVQQQTDVGKKAKDIMMRDELVRDPIIVGVVEDRISQADCSAFVLDGFPRTIDQADPLHIQLNSRDLGLDHVVELRVVEEILLDRIVTRAQQAEERGEAVRADDNRESLKIRLDAYKQETALLIEYYRNHHLLRTIDGLQPIDDVTRSIFAVLKGKVQ
jgi:adenylate kinase